MMKRIFKYGVLHVNSASAKSKAPTMRIARAVASDLKCPLIHNAISAEAYRDSIFGTLFVAFGMLRFSDHREDALNQYANAGHIVRLENDIAFQLDRRFNRNHTLWTTIPSHVRRGSGDAYVNWNMLTWFDHWAKEMPMKEPTETGLLYYGAFRADAERQRKFAKYLGETRRYKVHISSYRGGPKFRAICPAANIVNAFRDPTKIQDYRMALYLEDEASHETYTSPANRFYECLQLGVAQVFDASATTTLGIAGFDASPYVVSNRDHVCRALRNWQDIRYDQRTRWFANYRTTLRAQIAAAERKLR